MLLLFAAEEAQKIAVDANLYYFLAVLATSGSAIVAAIFAGIVNVLKARHEVMTLQAGFNELKDQVARDKEDHQRQITDMKTDHQRQITEMKNEHQEQISKLQDEHKTCQKENSQLKEQVAVLQGKVKALEIK